MSRRILAPTTVLAALLLLAAPSARAGESITSGNWNGSALDGGPSSVAVGAYELKGTFRHAALGGRQVQVTVSSDPAGAGSCAIAPVTLPSGDTPRAFSLALAIPCNGTYRLVANAVTTDNSPIRPADSAVLDRTVSVVAPPPNVMRLQLTLEDRVVELAWDDVSGAAPDLTGYIIERKVDDDTFTRIDRVGADEQTYTDDNLPDISGEATYRVLATRPSPDGEQMSASGDEASTLFEGEDTGSTGGTGGSDGSAGTGGSGSADGGAGGTGGSDTGSTGGSSGGSAGGARFAAPRPFSGSFLPPLLRPAIQTITTSTTLDPGYGDVLPYGARAGSAAPVDSGGNGVSSISSREEPRRGMVIPVATALVFAIWGFHLRVLARAARPIP